MKAKVKVTLIISFFALFLLTSCSSDDISKDIPTSISLNISKNTLKINDTLTASVIYKPKDIPKPILKWTSTNTNVATVINGEIIAKSVGNTIIIVSVRDNEELMDQTEITVEEKPNLTISTSGITSLKVGDSLTLDAKITPANTKYDKDDILWSISNVDIGEITTDNVFKALDEGNIVIQAKTADGLLEDSVSINIEHIYIESFSFAGELRTSSFTKTMKVGEKWEFDSEQLLTNFKPKNFTSNKVNLDLENLTKEVENSVASLKDNIINANESGLPVTNAKLTISSFEGKYERHIFIRVIDQSKGMEIGKEYIDEKGRGVIVNFISQSERYGPNGLANYCSVGYTVTNHSTETIQEGGGFFLFNNNRSPRSNVNVGYDYLEPGEKVARSLGRFTDSIEQTGDFFQFGTFQWLFE